MRFADNIAASLRQEPLCEFRFKTLGLLAGLGRRSAVAEVLGWKFSGFITRWLWCTIYLLKLPGFERKLRVAIDWTIDLFFPRDIVFLRPLHAPKGAGVVAAAPDAAPCQRPETPLPASTANPMSPRLQKA